jgi:PAS domain S-box-containing protein
MASKPETILIIDDSEAERYVMAHGLREAGFQVTEADTGEAGLLRAASVPDAIVLDVNLPDISGLEVCRKLKAAPQTAGIPVIQVSAAYTRPEDRVGGLDSGADAYLVQPCGAEELAATLRAMMRIRRLHREHLPELSFGQATTGHRWPAPIERFARGSPALFSYGLAVTSSLIALACTLALLKVEHTPIFIFFTVAVAFATWAGGRSAGLLAQALSTIASIYLLLPPAYTRGGFIRLATYLAIGAFIIWVVGRLRHSEARNLQLLRSERQARDKAEIERARTSSLLESVTDAFLAVDSEWRLTYINDVALRLVKRAGQNLIGRNLWEEFSVDSKFRPYFERVKQDRVPLHFEEFSNTTQSWVEVHAYPAAGGGMSVFFADITERKRAEQELAHTLERERKAKADLERSARALAESEARFRIMGEILPYGVWWCNAHGGAEYVSPSFCELLGMTLEEQKEFGWTRRLPPEEVEPMMKKWMHCVETGEDWDSEHHVLGPDGKYHTVLTRGKAVRDQSGVIVGWAGINLDIDERKKVEVRLRRFYESGMLGVIYWNMDGEITDANDKFLEMAGYTRDDLANGCLKWDQMTPPEYRHADQYAVDELKATGVATSYEKEYIRKDGTRVPVVVGAATIDEAHYEGVAFVLDVSERQRAEEALRRSQAALAHAGQMARLGAWHIEISNPDDLNSNPLYWSDEVYRIFGYQPGEVELSSQLFFERVHPDDRQLVADVMQKAIADRRVYELEHRIVRADGVERVVLEHADIIFSESGQPIRISGAVQDITERKRTEEALIRSEKLASVGRMAATIAHEINNPLAAITNLLYLVGSDRSLPEQARNNLRLAQGELNRAAHITKQTLGFYREYKETAQVSVPELVDEVLDLYSKRLQGKNLTVEKQCNAGDACIAAVAGEIRQVLSNLLSNGIDAVGEGGMVRVRVRSTKLRRAGEQREAVRITIADTGSGISPEHLVRIFDPFFTTKQTLGTGLGLWVTRQIVQRHGGVIHVRSRPGVGTAFSVVLPKEARSRPREAAASCGLN